MKEMNIGKFLFYVFGPLLMGTIVGFLFKDSFSFLEQVNRNIVVPPVVFIIAWSILYILMGIWYYLFDQNGEDKKTKKIFWILLVINLLFTPVLFYFQNIPLALLIVIVLLGGIGSLFAISIKRKYKFSYLLLPYLLWLIVALILMIDLLVNN